MGAWAYIKPAASANRSDVEVSDTELRLLSGTVTQSWGSQPATAELIYSATKGFAVSIADVVGGLAPWTYVEVYMPGQTFYGLSKSDVASDSSGGSNRSMLFVDLREYLAWDQVFCAFNVIDVVLLLNSDTNRIERRRRYKHLLPVNWSVNLWTYSDAPLSVAQILDYIFNAPTVNSGWFRQYHPDMFDLPAYDIDFTSGSGLATAILEVSSRLGLTYTLAGKFRLIWRRKGEIINLDANMPWASSPFPTLNDRFLWPPSANNCRGGYAGSENPSALRLVGDRNVYQILNVDMVPDWSAAWEVFAFEDNFVNYVYTHFTDPATLALYSAYPDVVIGMTRARAFALRVQVSEVAAVLGPQFLDARKYASKARNQLPAVLYIREIVFRAFRPPAKLLDIPTRSLRILDRQLCAVSHDASGFMTADITYPIDGNGYVIAKSIGLSSQAFASIRPEHFNLDEWILAATAWGVVSFTIDSDSGDQIPFILTQQKICNVQNAIKSVDGMGVLDATFQPAAVPVRACLTFAAERFVYTDGVGDKFGTVNESGLHQELVWDWSQGLIGEIPYANLDYPNYRARVLANSLLLRQPVVANGGFERPIDFDTAGTPLNGAIDRVTVSVTSSGWKESVDFTTERNWGTFVPERHYDRLTLDQALAPGQAQLREEQQLAGQLAVALASNPRARETMRNAMHLLLGDEEPTVVMQIQSGTGSLPMGTPLWRKTSELLPVMPSAVTADHSTFVGITTRDGEVVSDNAQIRLFNDGNVLARVLGPVSAGDGVGRAVGENYLSKGTPAIGSAQEDISGSDVQLVPVLLGGGGGGTGAALWD